MPLRQAIDSANRVEFALYKAVPQADTAQLNRYFTRSGTARTMILGGLDRAVRNGRQLRIPPSAYMLVDINVRSQSETEARVETDEQWYLLWYDRLTNQDVSLYDTLNHHQYWLKKEGGQWRIHMDEYRGRPKKVVR